MNTLGGKSSATSKAAMCCYYALAALSMFTGFTGLCAWIGALVSGRAARKEGAEIIAKHCKWISRTVWVTFLSTIISVLAFIGYMVSMDVNIPDTADFDSYIDKFIDTLGTSCNTADVNTFYISIILFILFILGISIWYYYRLIRGVITLLNDKAPKS